MTDALLMRFYGGLTPRVLNEMTMAQYNGYADQIPDIAEMESGTVDHRHRAEKLRRKRERGR